MSEFSKPLPPESEQPVVQASFDMTPSEEYIPVPVQKELAGLVETSIATHTLQDRARLSVIAKSGFYTDVTLLKDVLVVKLDTKIQRGKFSYPAVRLLENAPVYNGKPDGFYTIVSQEEVGVNTKGSLKTIQNRARKTK